jgi:hypothetical protein
MDRRRQGDRMELWHGKVYIETKRKKVKCFLKELLI